MTRRALTDREKAHEEAIRLAKEFCADPAARAQIKVQLAMNGWGKLADMIDEAVAVSRELLLLDAARNLPPRGKKGKR